MLNGARVDNQYAMFTQVYINNDARLMSLVSMILLCHIAGQTYNCILVTAIWDRRIYVLRISSKYVNKIHLNQYFLFRMKFNRLYLHLLYYTHILIANKSIHLKK
jgi:hypothetical protein